MPRRPHKSPEKASALRQPDLWRERPEVVRRFIEQRPDYECLCTEVQYVLQKRLGAKGIEVSAVTSRAKTLESFMEKVQRKEYADPFSGITDFAGVRVVCLYAPDTRLIDEVIQEEFDVVEKVDSLNERDSDRFGYGAIQYVVKLGKVMSGARYEDLRHLVCEVQVRTVLQDAWAIVAHHLTYKRESEVPKALQRKLNGLVGLFETADNQFDQIRREREEYVSEMRESSSSGASFLAHEVNSDSLREFLAWKLSDLPTEAFDGQLRLIEGAMVFDQYRSLKDIDDMLEQTSQQRDVLRATLPGIMKVAGSVPASIELAWALLLRDDGFYKRSVDHMMITPDWASAISSLRARS